MDSPLDKSFDYVASIPEERWDELDAEARERRSRPGYRPPPSPWSTARDPLGMGWSWLGIRGESTVESAPPNDSNTSSAAVNFRPRPHRFFWATGIAASLAAIAVGGWLALSRGPIVERDVTAWVTNQLETGGGGIRIAAPAGEEQSREPLIKGIDRPQDAPSPAAPNVYAPLRIQEQLVIPEVPAGLAPGRGNSKPLRSVVETVPPGALFYLEFTAAATPSPGSAVVVVSKGDSVRLLWEEVAVSPNDGTSYFGPLKMGDVEANYFVILADRTSTSLLTSVSQVLPNAQGASPESWRSELSKKLEDARHGWYGVQRIEVRPQATKR